MKKTVELGFVPEDSDDDEIRRIFANRTARTIWCLWKMNRIVSQHFNRSVLQIAERIDGTLHWTPETISIAFPMGLHIDFSVESVREFIAENFGFIAGHPGFELEIVTPETVKPELSLAASDYWKR